MNKRRVLLLLAGLGIYLASFLVTIYFVGRIEERNKPEAVPFTPRTGGFGEGSGDRYYNTLLLGYGGAGHPGGGLSDAIIVVSVNLDKKYAALINIPRDLWVEIPGFGKHKINNAFALGGGELAKEMIWHVLGIQIDNYAAIDFKGFTALIDELGGVEVDVPVTFDDRFYPVKGLENETCGKSGEEIAELSESLSGFELEREFECRYEHLHFDAGLQVMDGEAALKFVRSRHSAQHGGDFARHERQQALLVGIKDKLLESDLELSELFEKYSRYVESDLGIGEALGIVSTLGSDDEYRIIKINMGEGGILNNTYSNDGQYILVPSKGDGNWEDVRTYVESQMRKALN